VPRRAASPPRIAHEVLCRRGPRSPSSEEHEEEHFATPNPWALFLAAPVVRGNGPGPGRIPLRSSSRPRFVGDRRLRRPLTRFACTPSAETDHARLRPRVLLAAVAIGPRRGPTLPWGSCLHRRGASRRPRCSISAPAPAR
jgi:hypothetical protein